MIQSQKEEQLLELSFNLDPLETAILSCFYPIQVYGNQYHLWFILKYSLKSLMIPCSSEAGLAVPNLYLFNTITVY